MHAARSKKTGRFVSKRLEKSARDVSRSIQERRKGKRAAVSNPTMLVDHDYVGNNSCPEVRLLPYINVRMCGHFNTNLREVRVFEI